MYVDDFISGCDTIKDTLELRREMEYLFSKGGFKLRKWALNSQKVLDSIPSTNREAATCLDVFCEDVIKTLGVLWNTINDEFNFIINMSKEPTKLTKRTLLSDVAKLFDPLGFLAPVAINAKFLFQSLWLRGLEWDDPLPSDVVNEWLNLRSNLGDVAYIQIPRWLGISKFKAYAAVVFSRTIKDGQYCVQLLTSKTKVAPIKRVSLPNLELCGAALLAKLLGKVKVSMELDSHSSIYAWTDSTIVLDWIKSSTHKQTFVANRVSQILDHTKPSNWRHVRSKDNPADIATRGICPSQLKSYSLWWNGPHWLQQSIIDWPSSTPEPEESQKPPEPFVNTVTVTENKTDFAFDPFSSLDKLIRVTARCLQFAQKCKRQSTKANDE